MSVTLKAAASEGYDLSDNEFNASRSDFAYIDSNGRGHLPIHDEAHVRNALSRFDQTNFESPAKKKAAARKIKARAKKMGIDLSDDSAVMQAASAKDVSLDDLRQSIWSQLDEQSNVQPSALPNYCYLEEMYDDYVIVSCGACYYKVPYTRTDDGDMDGEDITTLAPRDQWQEVESQWVVKHFKVPANRSIKKLGETKDTIRVGQYGMFFGGIDLEGDTFTKDTDLWFDRTGPRRMVLYDHGQNEMVKSAVLGYTTSETVDDVGVFVEAELKRADQYTAFVMPLIEQGKLGWSSGAANYLIRKSASAFRSWPIVEWSFTPTPCEPRTLGIGEIKSLIAVADGLKALLPEDPGNGSTQPALSTASNGTSSTVIVTSPPPSPTATKGQEKRPMSVSLEQFETFQKSMEKAQADRDAALKTTLDGVSAILAKFESDPALKSAGFVSAKGGTNDPQIKSFADFLMAIRRGDEVRLESHYKSVKAALTEAGGDTGGWIVPIEFVAKLNQAAIENAMVRPRAGLIYPMSTREAEIPMLDQFTAPSGEQSAFLGGVIAQWVEEASALNETEPKFKLMRLIAHGLGGITLASNDLRADAAIALETLLTTLFGSAIGWHEDYAFLRGDGNGKPLGMLSWVGAISVTRHVASHFDLVDAGKMMGRLIASSMSRAMWIMSQTVIPEMVTLQSSAYNAWIPSTAQGMPGTLLGLPIMYTEKVPALGSAKDVSLIDWGCYVVGDRQGIEIAFSEHYRFANRQGTWRFFARRDGQPWMKDKITLNDGTTTVSPAVYLT